jgi:formylglycine-generating enzyme required for sulfatase activity
MKRRTTILIVISLCVVALMATGWYFWRSHIAGQQLFDAALEWDDKKLQILLRLGADPNTRFEWRSNRTPLQIVAGRAWTFHSGPLTPFRYSKSEHPMLILIRHGAKVNGTDNEGNTALHYIAVQENMFPDMQDNAMEMAKILLDAGADVNARNNEGLTPLDSAYMSSSPDKQMLDFLETCGGLAMGYYRNPAEGDDAKRRQEETSGNLGMPVEKEMDLGGGVRMKFMLVPAGEFRMGTPDDQYCTSNVRITKPFYIGAAMVTQAQWKAVMGNNPSRFQNDDLPVECVSWFRCQEFLKKLPAKEGETYRLPTGAEWEYAARAGTTTPFYGKDPKALWEQRSMDKTLTVSARMPNAWGLYDMDVRGIMWNWCEDRLDEAGSLQKSGTVIDPTGPAQGAHRVMQGGFQWDINGRSVNGHLGGDPQSGGSLIGFRVVCTRSCGARE